MWSLIARAGLRAAAPSRSSSATDRRALGRGSSVVAWARLRRSWVSATAPWPPPGTRACRGRWACLDRVGRPRLHRARAAGHRRLRSMRGSPRGASSARRCAGALQRAADVHQARVVGRAQTSARAVDDRARPCRRSIAVDVSGVLDRERAAEAAARLGVRQLHQVDAAHLPQQPQRGVADAQSSAASGRSGGR